MHGCFGAVGRQKLKSATGSLTVCNDGVCVMTGISDAVRVISFRAKGSLGRVRGTSERQGSPKATVRYFSWEGDLYLFL